MKFLFFLLFLLSISSIWAQEDSPVWPQIGSVFPKGDKIQKKEINRNGTNYWVEAPKVISPYAPNWFEYNVLMWGVDKRIAERTTYFEFLKTLNINAGFVYSSDNPDSINKAKLPFYNTNITNLLYLRNKGGMTLRNKYKETKNNEFLSRTIEEKKERKSASLENKDVDMGQRTIAKNNATRLASSSPLAYDLRDEGTYTVSSASPMDFDFSPVSLQAFQIWLKANYRTIERLNAKWETSFKNWEEVKPMTTDEIFARELPKAKTNGNITEFSNLNLAPWADHREYNDDTMHSAVARYINAIHEADPLAPVGYSGTQMPSAYGGFDYWKISNNISWIEYYDINGSREILKGFMPKDFLMIHAISMGSDLTKQFPRVWNGILHGDAGTLIWPFNGNDLSASLAIDLEGQNIKATTKGNELAQLFRKIRNGVPVVLRHAQFEKQEIAIYYSQSSIRADWVLEVKRDGVSWINRSSSWESGHNYAAAGREGIYKLIEDLGYQCTQISQDQVENNQMQSLGIKVIIMPRIISISNKEIESLKSFVKNGGTLITDVLAGRLDEHCVDYKDKLEINELLGIHRSTFAYQEELKAEDDKKSYVGGFGYPIEISIEEDFGELKKGSMMKVQGFYEPKVSLNKSKAFGKTSIGPVLIKNTFGKGCVYTLNFDLPNYLSDRNSIDTSKLKNCEGQRAIFKTIFEVAQVAKFSKISNANNTYPAGVETFVYTQGESKYLAIQVNQSNLIDWVTLNDIAEKNVSINELPLKIELPESLYVTEMMSEKTYGKSNVLNVILNKDSPLIFSLLKYAVTDLTVKSTFLAENGLMPIAIELIAEGNLGDHVVNVELFDKGKNPVPQFRVNVPLIKGKYNGNFDLSHVKDKGGYELVFKDVLSGKSVKKEITIK